MGHTGSVSCSSPNQAVKIGSNSLDIFTQEELELAKSQALLSEYVETPTSRNKETKRHWYTIGKFTPTKKTIQTEIQELVDRLNQSSILTKDVDHSIIDVAQREKTRKRSKAELKAIEKTLNEQKELKKLIIQKTKEMSRQIMTSPTIMTNIQEGKWNSQQNFVMLPPIAESEKQAKRLMALQ